nr:hypothetical protein [Ardenticatena sp.]
MNRATWARWLSILFDSSVLSLWVFPLVGWYAGGWRGLIWALVALLLLSGIPLAYLLIGRRRGWVSDLELSNRRERPRFIAVSLASDLLALVVLGVGGAPRLVWTFALIYACLGVSMLLISSVWKISLHMVSVAGFATVLTYVFGIWGTLLYGALLPVAWARLERRKHTPAQLVAGALAGVFIPAAVLWFIRP